MGAGWDQKKGQALKILGSKGKVPDVPGAVDKAVGSMEKANDEFDNSRNDLQTKIKALKTTMTQTVNSLRQFLATIQKADFGLDTKDKDDAKKILQARSILVGTINDTINGLANDKSFDELSKHVEQLGDYKPPKATV